MAVNLAPALHVVCRWHRRGPATRWRIGIAAVAQSHRMAEFMRRRMCDVRRILELHRGRHVYIGILDRVCGTAHGSWRIAYLGRLPGHRKAPAVAVLYCVVLMAVRLIPYGSPPNYRVLIRGSPRAIEMPVDGGRIALVVIAVSCVGDRSVAF